MQRPPQPFVQPRPLAEGEVEVGPGFAPQSRPIPAAFETARPSGRPQSKVARSRSTNAAPLRHVEVVAPTRGWETVGPAHLVSRPVTMSLPCPIGPSSTYRRFAGVNEQPRQASSASRSNVSGSGGGKSRRVRAPRASRSNDEHTRIGVALNSSNATQPPPTQSLPQPARSSTNPNETHPPRPQSPPPNTNTNHQEGVENRAAAQALWNLRHRDTMSGMDSASHASRGSRGSSRSSNGPASSSSSSSSSRRRRRQHQPSNVAVFPVPPTGATGTPRRKRTRQSTIVAPAAVSDPTHRTSHHQGNESTATSEQDSPPDEEFGPQSQDSLGGFIVSPESETRVDWRRALLEIDQSDVRAEDRALSRSARDIVLDPGVRTFTLREMQAEGASGEEEEEMDSDDDFVAKRGERRRRRR
jgi:hypothetical protein